MIVDMALLNRKLIQLLMDHHLNKELFHGQFGLEKENVRVIQREDLR